MQAEAAIAVGTQTTRLEDVRVVGRRIFTASKRRRQYEGSAAKAESAGGGKCTRAPPSGIHPQPKEGALPPHSSVRHWQRDEIYRWSLGDSK